jgi:hypothetical protein
MFLYQQSKDAVKGSVVVLSPVKESSSSNKRVATPVRRSSRTATVSTEEKNQDALRRAEYNYAPNSALLAEEQAAVSTTSKVVSPAIDNNEVRRSARTAKSVERLSPKLGTKYYN